MPYGLHAEEEAVLPAAHVEQRAQYRRVHVHHAPHGGVQGAFPRWAPLRDTLQHSVPCLFVTDIWYCLL